LILTDGLGIAGGGDFQHYYLIELLLLN